ncbi:MAG: ABC transporter permease subunit [Nocardioidaceae bacterium]
MRVRFMAIVGFLAFGLLCLAAPASAHAPDSSSSSAVARAGQGAHINVTLVNTSKATKANPRGTPVPGVKITVTAQDGKEIGSGVTNAQGKVSIAVPSSGTFVTKIDVSTLPKGTFLTNAKDVEHTVQMFGFDSNVLFPIGPDTRKTTSELDQAIALAVSGLKFGLIIALASLGLSLIFGTTGLVNFAHGELVTLGGLAAYFFNQVLPIGVSSVPLLVVGGHLSVIAAGVVAVVVCAGLGWFQDVGFWRQLRRRGTGNLAMMIISIGMGLLLRNLYQYIFGGESKSYSQYVDQTSRHYGPIELADKELVLMIVAIVVLVLVSIALARTRLGKATRAVSDNASLAASSGINVNGIVSMVWVFGTGLAALSGVLLGVDQQVDYQMGFHILLLVFAAVTLGGLGTIWGAMAGSLIVGIGIEMSTLIIPDELKYIGALGVLVVILVIRPQGLLGRAQRVG